jgi:hypothetical protein
MKLSVSDIAIRSVRHDHCHPVKLTTFVHVIEVTWYNRIQRELGHDEEGMELLSVTSACRSTRQWLVIKFRKYCFNIISNFICS